MFWWCCSQKVAPCFGPSCSPATQSGTSCVNNSTPSPRLIPSPMKFFAYLNRLCSSPEERRVSLMLPWFLPCAAGNGAARLQCEQVVAVKHSSAAAPHGRGAAGPSTQHAAGGSGRRAARSGHRGGVARNTQAWSGCTATGRFVWLFILSLLLQSHSVRRWTVK